MMTWEKGMTCLILKIDVYKLRGKNHFTYKLEKYVAPDMSL